jgi:hypothetical protein
MVGVDLMVEPDERVDVGAILGDREAQFRPCGEWPGTIRVVHLTLETEEEVRLVLLDRPADDAAVFALGGRRLGQRIGGAL